MAGTRFPSLFESANIGSGGEGSIRGQKMKRKGRNGSFLNLR